MSKDRDELSPVVPTGRDRAVDVSANDNNCFFHSYALYLLSNDLPLPQDLFTTVRTAIDIPLSPAEKLKKTFKSPSDLDIFNQKNRKHDSSVTDKEMLFEKTIVLGVLFREWFAKELKIIPINQQRTHVMEAVQAYRVALDASDGSEKNAAVFMKSDKYGALFEANSAMFQEFKVNNPTEAQIVEMYQRYADHLAKPMVMVSYADFATVLTQHEVAYQVYDKKSGAEAKGSERPLVPEGKPLFEIALAAGEGHYYLMSDKKFEQPFMDYAQSLAEYRGKKDKIAEIIGVGQDAIRSPDIIKPTHSVTDRLTDKEQQVFNKLATSIVNNPQGDAYKQRLKDLIISHREVSLSKSSENSINPKEIDKAEALKNTEGEQIETDEDFAKRLQDAEFDAVNLGSKGPRSS